MAPIGDLHPTSDPQVLDPRRPHLDPVTSEASRLLCVGVHFDGAFRRRGIDELCVHVERFTAPSSGRDAVRVLAHALYARRVQFAYAQALAMVWLTGVFTTDFVFLLLVCPCLLIAFAAAVARYARAVPDLTFLRGVAFPVRWPGWLNLLHASLAVAGGVVAALASGAALSETVSLLLGG
ncbi:hypothetical protein ACFVIM_11015 [Streptomyces sp. NPDC057638]|uniref:hypothetical protein n=1 Tax=Streptomyces sp. NPDC057638 TaxID=3346190 RepID=UPI0036C88E67